MSFRYTGGLLTTASPVNAQYPSGVWTQQQSAIYQAQGLFATDPNFRYTSLLLNGNGTNGAQNNTFLDSSTNNFTITRNGNTTQGTFTPYVPNGWWSNYFDGSGDYLQTPSNAAFDLSTGNWTIELWVYLTASYDSYYGGHLIGSAEPNTGTGGWSLVLRSGSIVVLGNGNSQGIYAVNFQLNTWNHIAFVRSGTGANSASLYFNGAPYTATGNGAGNPTFNSTNGPVYIGEHPSYTVTAITGYISNARVVKGTAVYTINQSSITVPTTPLTAVSGTSLLTCQSNRFIDNSTNNFTITKNGDTSVQQFQPFPRTVAYSATGTGGSGYFDGSGDYLNTPSTGQFAPTGDFTISCWYYPTSTRTYQQIIGNFNGSASTVWIFEVTSGTGINFYTNGITPRISGSGLVVNAWNYLVLARSGSTITGYVNGVSIGTYAQSGTFGSATQAISIGRGGSSTAAGDFGLGYIADVKLIDGSAVTTVPTAPQTATSGTNLLLSYTNAGIFDNALSGDLETVGNAQVSTSVVKYGTGSMYFDGTNSSLPTYSNLQNFQFAAGNFTVECWVNKTANGTNAYDCVVGLGSTINATEGWYLEVSTSRGIYFVINNTSVSFATWANDGVWHHIAVTRSSGTLYIFKDGVLLTSGSLTTSVPTTATAARIGNYYNGSTNYYYSGYIDDLRITKGLARYTASFTPPIAPFPKQ